MQLLQQELLWISMQSIDCELEIDVEALFDLAWIQ